MEGGPGWGPDQPRYKLQDRRCPGLPAEAYLSTLDSKSVYLGPLWASGGHYLEYVSYIPRIKMVLSFPITEEKRARPQFVPVLSSLSF